MISNQSHQYHEPIPSPPPEEVKVEEEEVEEILAKRMKLMEVNERKPKGNGGRKQVFKSPITIRMLAPETWEKILNYLPLPDFIRAINTCKEWNEILHSRKTDTLMPLVLPQLLEYLPLQKILDIRHVNKSIFKKFVDKTLLQYSVEHKHLFGHDPNWIDSMNSLSSKVESIRSRCRIERVADLQAFLRRSQPLFDCGANPFLTGNLELQLGREGVDADGENVEPLFELTTKFGHYITSLRISIYNGVHAVPTATLFRLLGVLPKLKDLRLNSMIPNAEVASFQIERLPEIPSLESLCVMSFAARDRINDVSVILPFLYRYGRQLKVFSCGGRLMGSRNFGLGSLNTLLPNVSHVRVAPVNVHSMMKLAMVGWKQVKMLRISRHAHPNEAEWNCKVVDVVRVINHFRHSLTNIQLLVTVTFRGSRAVERVDPREMKEVLFLRKLTTEIENVRGAWFWDFLGTSCINLQELHFRILPHDSLEVEDELKARTAFGLLSGLKNICFWFFDKPRIMICK